MMFQVIEMMALLLLLLVTGVFWGPWLALHRSLHRFTGEEFLRIVEVLGKNLGRPMQIMMPTCVLFMTLCVVLFPEKGTTNFYLMIGSLVFIIITLIVTMTTELPIIKKIATWTPETLPFNWQNVRDKWVRFHTLRVFPAIISFALFMIVLLRFF